jgi:hypothetical protein
MMRRDRRLEEEGHLDGGVVPLGYRVENRFGRSIVRSRKRWLRGPLKPLPIPLEVDAIC